jgi:hypothetical protein
VGMIRCSTHEWSGVASMTPAAADAFDRKAKDESIVLVELVFDEVPFFLYALKQELPFADTKPLDEGLEVSNEERLNEILGTLVPRCGKCLNALLGQ